MANKKTSDKYLGSIKLASKALQKSEQELRVLAQQEKLTFITAIRNSKDSGYRYYTDMAMLEKVKNGEAPMFRG